MRSSVAGIAQLVEQLTCNQKVPSSTLGAGTKFEAPIVRLGLFSCAWFTGRLGS